MTRLGTRIQAEPLHHTSGLIGRVVAVALAIAVLFVGSSFLDPARLVPRLTAVNPGPYQVNLEIGRPGSAGWSDLGTVGRASTKVIEEVVDEGSSWVFRFSYGRVPAGELTVSRTQLKGDGWKFTVPPEIFERLRAAGLPPSAS